MEAIRSSYRLGCYGIASQDMGPNWVCELCSNVQAEANNMVSDLSGIKYVWLIQRIGSPLRHLPRRSDNSEDDQEQEASTRL